MTSTRVAMGGKMNIGESFCSNSGASWLTKGDLVTGPHNLEVNYTVENSRESF